MYLYGLTLQTATGIQSVAYGNFSGPKALEIVVSRGKVLDLLRPDENGKMQTVLRWAAAAGPRARRSPGRAPN